MCPRLPLSWFRISSFTASYSVLSLSLSSGWTRLACLYSSLFSSVLVSFLLVILSIHSTQSARVRVPATRSFVEENKGCLSCLNSLVPTRLLIRLIPYLVRPNRVKDYIIRALQHVARKLSAQSHTHHHRENLRGWADHASEHAHIPHPAHLARQGSGSIQG